LIGMVRTQGGVSQVGRW